MADTYPKLNLFSNKQSHVAWTEDWDTVIYSVLSCTFPKIVPSYHKLTTCKSDSMFLPSVNVADFKNAN